MLINNVCFVNCLFMWGIGSFFYAVQSYWTWKNGNEWCLESLRTTGLHNINILKGTHRPALLPCKADLFVRCHGPSPKERQSSAAVKHWTPAAPNWGESTEREQDSNDGTWYLLLFNAASTTKQILIEPVLQKKINVWWVELRTRRAWTCSWRSATLVHGGRDGRPGGSSWSQADRSAAPTCLAWCHSTWTRWSEMTPNCQFLTVLTYPFTYSLTHYWCKAGNCAEKHCAS